MTSEHRARHEHEHVVFVDPAHDPLPAWRRTLRYQLTRAVLWFLVRCWFRLRLEGLDRLPPPPYARPAGEVIQAMLSQVGINAKIENVEWAQWLDGTFKNKNFDLTIISHVEPNDFGNFGKEGYYFNYTNPKFAELMTELGNTTDTAKQTEIKQEIQKLLANDFAAGFLFEFPNITVANKSLTGFWENSPLPASPVAELKWTE